MFMLFLKNGELSESRARNVKVCLVAVVAVWCFILIRPATAQISLSGFKRGELLKRIERGEYVWSLDFPQKDAALLGYGLALVDTVRHLCPVYHELPDEEIFSGGWIMANLTRQGSLGQNLRDTLKSTIEMMALSPAAQSDTERLVKLYGCDAQVTKRVMDNAARMIAGRRPAHGEHSSSSLVAEQVSPVSGKHVYEHSFEGLQSPGLLQLEHDMKQFATAGFQVLECRYDADAEDEYYEVQYYWSIGLASAASITGTLPVFVWTAQQSLQKANGVAKVRHPFLDYAYPQVECPAHRDPQLPVKQIYAKRKSRERPIPENFAKPAIRKKGTETVYDYGVVPESFVPTILADIPLTRNTFKMEKERPGSLIQMSIAFLGWYSLPRTDGDYKDRPREQKMLQADVSAADGRVLECLYLAEEHGTGLLYRFWYKTRPAVAEPARLRSRIPDHPMLDIKSPREICPETAELAESIQ
jgi:hypothetical protein